MLEYDPLTQGKSAGWYENENSSPFMATVMGSVQRLDNGNTLIVEPKRFRIFEVTGAKELVWEISAFKEGEPVSPTASDRFGCITGMRRYDPGELDFLKGRVHARPQ